MHMARPTTPRVQPIEKVAVQAREAMKSQPINAVNVTATMAHNRVLSKAFGPFAQAVLFGGDLPRRQVEIAVLRMGWNCQSVYEFGQHTLFGRDAGLSDAEIYLTTRPISQGTWTDAEQVDPPDRRRPVRRRLRLRRDVGAGHRALRRVRHRPPALRRRLLPHGQRPAEQLRRGTGRRRAGLADRPDHVTT